MYLCLSIAPKASDRLLGTHAVSLGSTSTSAASIFPFKSMLRGWTGTPHNNNLTEAVNSGEEQLSAWLLFSLHLFTSTENSEVARRSPAQSRVQSDSQ